MGRKKSRRQKGGTEAKPRQKTKNQRIKQKKRRKEKEK
jgi:hypothetical protein